jgi:GntR family transcriptional repressor for pyruvate dehydrogenase complex
MMNLVDPGSQFSAEEFIQFDLKFHTAILEACHNELMAQLGQIMRQALLTGRHIDRPRPGDKQTSLHAHQAIARAIDNHDPDEAYRAAQEHIDEVWSEIGQRWKREAD